MADIRVLLRGSRCKEIVFWSGDFNINLMSKFIDINDVEAEAKLQMLEEVLAESGLCLPTVGACELPHGFSDVRFQSCPVTRVPVGQRAGSHLGLGI